MIWDTGLYVYTSGICNKKKLNSKQRNKQSYFLSQLNIPATRMAVCCWLPFHPSASLRCLPAANMFAASSRVTVVIFGNVYRRPVDSSNLFATPRGTAAKFSVVHLPLKRRVSRTPLHSAAAPILNPESEQRASQTIRSHLHEVDPSLVTGERHTTSCLRSQETLHFLLATLMSVGKERGELRTGRNLVLRF